MLNVLVRYAKSNASNLLGVMTSVSPIVKPVSQMRLAPGSTVIIPNVSWEEFESILQELGEKRSARVAYSKCTLEIMVPL